MSLGSLVPTVQLHKPDHVYYGPDDPIEGHIRLKWIKEGSAADSEELFGPAKILVTLHGVMKANINKQGPDDDFVDDFDAFKAQIHLFSTKQCILDGPLRIQQGEIQNFPYKIHFPRDWRYQPDTRLAKWSIHPGYNPDDKMFSLDPDQPMPPSMKFQEFEFFFDGEVRVEYRVSAEVVMPNLDVEVTNNNIFASKEVMYERPKVDQAVPSQFMPCEGTLRVQDKCLIPDDERPKPHGFRQKASAVFRPSPKPLCVLDWCITAPKSVHRGQPLLVQIHCQPSLDLSTTTISPSVKLLRVDAIVQTLVYARGQRSSINEKHWHGRTEGAKETITLGAAEHETQSNTSTHNEKNPIGTPFEKGNEWTQAVVFENLTQELGSSFKSVFIRREYLLYVKCQVSVSGKMEELQRSLTIDVNPSLAGQKDTHASSSWTSSNQAAEENESESLPAYEA